jgi:hypothetical protein
VTVLGEAAAVLSYEAFKAASATGTAFGGLLTAARAAAIAAIVTDGALVAGAGLAGFAIGNEILRRLEYTGPEPTVRQLYKAPPGSGRIRVFAVAKFKNQPEQQFENVFDSPIVGPVSFDNGGILQMGVLVGPSSTFVQYTGAGRDLYDQPLTITGVTAENGSPVPNLLRMPTFAPTFPTAVPTLPTTIPIAPGEPDFPITPTVVPNPANDPSTEDEKAKTPGVIVQVPEAGQQVVFTPTGVQIQNYSAPNTRPYEFPKFPPPPNPPKVAQQECPCPEGENKSAEIICRIKTLQKELLDDGFTQTVRSQGPAQCVSDTGFDKEFRFIEVTATQVPANAKQIPYPSPGISTVFVGNIQFEIKGGYTDPIPVRSTHQVTPAPAESTGYVVSSAFGFEVRANAYLYVKKDYVDNC